jgi:transposase
MISAEQSAEIRRLFYAEHWKVGTIAEAMGLHRDTVKRAIGTESFLTRCAARPRPTKLDPYLPFVRQTLEQYPKLRATRLHQMLVERGYQGSVVQLRRALGPLRPRSAGEAYLELRTLAGEQAQADWGSFGTWGKRRLSCFVMVLSWSRAIHAVFTLDQSMESFLRGHIEAFEYFEGVPRAVLYDNLKSAVLERRGEAIRFHPRLLELCGHYHFAPRPVAVARGNEKGRVERQIQYLRTSFFAARHFRDVEDLNDQFRRWREQVAHQRQQPVERQGSVGEAFGHEKSFLLPLPQHPFEAQSVKVARSGKTPYLSFDRNRYSIPHTLVRKPLSVVADRDTVRIVDAGHETVATHRRSWAVGETVENPEHIAELVRTKRAARELKGRDLLRVAVPESDRIFEELARRGDHLGGHTVRLLQLLDDYGPEELRCAVTTAIERQAWGAGSVAHILEQRRRARGEKPRVRVELPADPRVRNLRVKSHDLGGYDALIDEKDDDKCPDRDHDDD